MKMSKENGAETINGAMMLAHQGALAFELFSTKKRIHLECINNYWRVLNNV